jgi:tripartite motif-containing protein 71
MARPEAADGSALAVLAESTDAVPLDLNGIATPAVYYAPGAEGGVRLVLVPNPQEHCIYAYGPDGALVWRLGGQGAGTGDGEFNMPCGLCVLPGAGGAAGGGGGGGGGGGDVLVVADSGNNRLQMFDLATRRHLRTVGERGRGQLEFRYPYSVCRTAAGDLAVVDADNHRIQVLRPSEGYAHVRTFGSKGKGDGQFGYPMGLALAADGTLLVADYVNHRVVVVSEEGALVRSIGLGEGSGPGQLDYPCSVCVEPSGLILVGESGNNRVSVFTLEGGGEGDGEGGAAGGFVGHVGGPAVFGGARTNVAVAADVRSGDVVVCSAGKKQVLVLAGPV